MGPDPDHQRRAGRELIRTVQSPNFGPRRGGARPSMVILHYTAMADCAAAERALCDPVREVSAHYLISENGTVTQLVAEQHRAWHAGQSRWGAIDDVNSHSIGIELSNTGFAPFAAALMDSLEHLLAGILDRWSIPPERVLAHSDVAPGRKIDPGARFDWARLARQGLAIQLPKGGEQAVDDALFRSNLVAAGYADLPLETLLPAFRLRHRAGHAGALDTVDMALSAVLADRYPVVDPNGECA